MLFLDRSESRYSKHVFETRARNEDMKQQFKRITVDPNHMGGIPCVRGLRIPVATVVGMVSEGMTELEILTAYPDLELEDIREVVHHEKTGDASFGSPGRDGRR